MTLVGTSVFNGFATIVRILSVVVLNKILAVFVGPSGYVLVGQLLNAIGIANSIAGGAISVGVIRFTAQYEDEPFKQRDMWRAATGYSVIATLVTSLALVVFSTSLADGLFGDRSLAVVFVALGSVMPLATLNGLLLAVLNGKEEVRAYAVQATLASVVGCGVTAAAAMRFGTVGALVALSMNVATAAAITFALCARRNWLKVGSFFGRVSAGNVRPLLGYALMTLTSAVAAGGSQLLVRDRLIQDFGAGAAGNWQATFKVSEIYLTLFTATLGLYYLPRIAQMREGIELRAEILRLYRFLLPVSAAAAILLFMLRDQLVSALFTAQFAEMADLLGWQLFGDVLKVGSWVLGFVMVGRGMVRWYVFTEVLFSASWVVLVWILIPAYGLLGAAIAFACNYAIYWLFMAWLIGRKLNRVLA